MMRLRISKLIAAVGAVAGLSACAQVSEGPLQTGPAETPVACSSLGLVDRDNDGLITRTEWGGFRDAAFDDWDINNDYRISRNEFRTCWGAGGFRNDDGFQEDAWNVNFTAFDDDHDEFLDEDEFFGDDAFGAFDENDDAGISPHEWAI